MDHRPELNTMNGAAITTCPGCGLQLPDQALPPDPRYRASGECRNLYHELSVYTLTHGGEEFIHQVIVDAYGAQHAESACKNITTGFALIGLYLVVEKGYTGKDVQRMHTLLARQSKSWPSFPPITHSASVTVQHVLHAEPGPERDAMIYQWGAAVWQTWREQHQNITALTSKAYDDGPL